MLFPVRFPVVGFAFPAGEEDAPKSQGNWIDRTDEHEDNKDKASSNSSSTRNTE